MHSCCIKSNYINNWIGLEAWKCFTEFATKILVHHGVRGPRGASVVWLAEEEKEAKLENVFCLKVKQILTIKDLFVLEMTKRLKIATPISAQVIIGFCYIYQTIMEPI